MISDGFNKMKMIFCTSIHCIDGRIQNPILKYLKEAYGIAYIDVITEPGPCKIIAEGENKTLIDSIIKRVEISLNLHGSKLIAISGHYDCARNPSGKNRQIKQIKKSIERLSTAYPKIKVIGLWIDADWKVNPV